MASHQDPTSRPFPRPAASSAPSTRPDLSGWTKDPDQFAELYRRSVGDLLKWFQARVASPQIAFDLTAETFAVAWEKRRRWRPTGKPPEAWLFGIARNVLLNNARRSEREARAVRRLGLRPIDLGTSPHSRVEELVDVHQARRELSARISEMSELDRDVLTLRYVEELDHGEIGRRLSISTGTARVRCHRALKRLDAQLSISHPTNGDPTDSDPTNTALTNEASQ